MADIRGYKDLIAWQKAMTLVETVYQITGRFPAQERFCLVPQVRRAAISIPSNIAEGHGRRSRADYVRFLDIARASANELETQLLIAVRLRYLAEHVISPAVNLCDEVQRIIKGLIMSLEKDRERPRRQAASELRAQSSELSDEQPQS